MVKSKIPAGITAEHVLGAISDFEAGVPHDFGDSTRYDLIHDGKRYPPKAILGLAALRATGSRLSPKDFSGGEKCNGLLTGLGFKIDSKSTPAWSLEPGKSIRRMDVHEAFGGSGQGGIAGSKSSPNIFLFTDAPTGEQFGHFDGWRDDGCFHYSGEGQRGDMEFVRGNKAILHHREDGRALRLFEGSGGDVKYLGEFELDLVEPFHRADGPDRDGTELREVIVFHLRRVSDASETKPQPQPKATHQQPVVELVEPETAATTKFAQTTKPATREADRKEGSLVERYLEHTKQTGRKLMRNKIAPPNEPNLFSDLYDVERNLLIEAKGSVTRESIRMAIGQILDYQRFLTPKPALALLLPQAPRPDLVALLHGLGICIIHPAEEGFVEMAPPSS